MVDPEDLLSKIRTTTKERHSFHILYSYKWRSVRSV